MSKPHSHFFSLSISPPQRPIVTFWIGADESRSIIANRAQVCRRQHTAVSMMQYNRLLTLPQRHPRCHLWTWFRRKRIHSAHWNWNGTSDIRPRPVHSIAHNQWWVYLDRRPVNRHQYIRHPRRPISSRVNAIKSVIGAFCFAGKLTRCQKSWPNEINCTHHENRHWTNRK